MMNTLSAVLMVAILLNVSAVRADRPCVPTHQSYADNATSAGKVKKDLREALKALDEYPSGSCINNFASEICNLVAGLDTRVGGKILEDNPSEPNIAISAADLKLMKLIFSQCKPTNYYFWNMDSILHVWYRPSREIDASVRQSLGLRP